MCQAPAGPAGGNDGRAAGAGGVACPCQDATNATGWLNRAGSQNGDLWVVERYRRDLVLRPIGEPGGERSRGERGRTFRWTRDMRERWRFVAANCDLDWHRMFCFTYPGSDDWPRSGAVVKSHLQRMWQWFERQGVGVEDIWRLEFQARGAPHFQGLIDDSLEEWIEWDGLSAVRDAIAERWSKIVGGSARCSLDPIEDLQRSVAYLSGYLAKKSGQSVVPDDFQHVGRMWGRSRGVTVTCQGLAVVDLDFARTVRRTARQVYQRRGGRVSWLFKADRRGFAGWGMSDIGCRLLSAAGVQEWRE